MAINKFYPTPSTTKSYINEIELDDMFRLDFKRNINHQPIYGYDDQQFGFIAKGKELVSGQIIINFRYPGYLTAVIRNSAKYKDIIDKSMEIFKPTDNQVFTEVQDDFLKTNIESLEGEDKMKYIAQILTGKGVGAREKQIIKFKNDLKDLYINDARNEDKAVLALEEFSGLQSPLDFDTSNNKFDLVVKYGFQNDDGMYQRIFRDCVLVGESSTISAAAGAGNDMSSSAQGILEVYPFFARTIDIIRN